MLFRGPSGEMHFATLLQTLYVLQLRLLHYMIVLDAETHSEVQQDESGPPITPILSF